MALSLFPASLDTFYEIAYSVSTSASNIVHASTINKLSEAVAKLEKKALTSLLTDTPVATGESGQEIRRFIGITHIDEAPQGVFRDVEHFDCYVGSWRLYEIPVVVPSGGVNLPLWADSSYAVYVNITSLGKDSTGALANLASVPGTITRYTSGPSDTGATIALIRAALPYNTSWVYTDVLVVDKATTTTTTTTSNNLLINPSIESPWPDTTYLQTMSATARTAGTSAWAKIPRPWGPTAYVPSLMNETTDQYTQCEYCYFPTTNTSYNGRACGVLQPEYRSDTEGKWPVYTDDTYSVGSDFGLVDDETTGRRWIWGQLLNLDTVGSPSGTARTYRFSMMYKMKYPPKAVWSPTSTLSYYCDLNLHAVGYNIVPGAIEADPASYVDSISMYPSWWMNYPTSGSDTITCKTLQFKQWPYWDSTAGNEPTVWVPWSTEFTITSDVTYLRLVMEFVSRGSQRPSNDFFSQTKFYFDSLSLTEIN